MIIDFQKYKNNYKHKIKLTINSIPNSIRRIFIVTILISLWTLIVSSIGYGLYILFNSTTLVACYGTIVSIGSFCTIMINKE
jgi:hypothetical protein